MSGSLTTDGANQSSLPITDVTSLLPQPRRDKQALDNIVFASRTLPDRSQAGLATSAEVDPGSQVGIAILSSPRWVLKVGAGWGTGGAEAGIGDP